ncbi:MAG: GHMP kinase [Nitrosopumilus sp.]|nr:GHMP kinase [Nitrosopumilus sp.]MDA7942440.1 GHMP kinase [Nitrosopumilus sp.]MDA7953543.1 GHMP kinase [Nitrosopumilus sp.]MDA7958686.1 GHMP kinase [Nitrosopumilus sp.]
MQAAAFCPAHVTGFFKAFPGDDPDRAGSTGAGFSLSVGVTTRVRVSAGSGHVITASGHDPGGTAVSEHVLRQFEGIAGPRRTEVCHEVGVPAGYGLGASAAAALSLSLALDAALGTGLGREGAARVAHRAEIACRTGLGDVIAALHGGLEVRTRPGAPGIGEVVSRRSGDVAVISCIAPVRTSSFMRDGMDRINGRGGRMVSEMLESPDTARFQEMSLEFARHAGVVTPRMEEAAARIRGAGAPCGVALFGETVFSLVEPGGERRVLDALEGAAGTTITSGIGGGARMVG